MVSKPLNLACLSRNFHLEIIQIPQVENLLASSEGGKGGNRETEAAKTGTVGREKRETHEEGEEKMAAVAKSSGFTPIHSGDAKAKLKQKTRAAKIVSLYTRTPPYDAALEELETFSLDRLKVLRGIERARLSNSSETDVRQKTKELLRKYLAGSGDEVRKDQISHFMLRLAYCQTEDLRR